jgi:GNAT superfamily N-acetyltransferase
MVEGPTELLTAARRAEAKKVFWSAFVDAVPDPAPRGAVFASRRFTAAATRMTFDALGSAADARWYGLDADGTLVSAALLTDADARLRLRAYLELMRFGAALVWMLGCSGIRGVVREIRTWPRERWEGVGAAFSPRPGFQELQLIATSPSIQARGYGERLLTFLKEKAATRGYRGLSLTTTLGSPAHSWYLRHGFETQVAFRILDAEMCRMTLQLNRREDSRTTMPNYSLESPD